MRENNMFEVMTENLQKICEIEDSGYMEEFWHEDFCFYYSIYLFI
jgi:hypothetical protein